MTARRHTSRLTPDPSVTEAALAAMDAGELRRLIRDIIPWLDEPTLALRRQYNEVAATIDTLVRVYEGNQLADLADPDRAILELPEGARLVLLFWADDEAELFLNGNPVGRTRLTHPRRDPHHLRRCSEHPRRPLLGHGSRGERLHGGALRGGGQR